MIENETLEQTNHFRYGGYNVTLLEDPDIDVKIQNSEICVALLGENLKEKLEKINRYNFTKLWPFLHRCREAYAGQ